MSLYIRIRNKFFPNCKPCQREKYAKKQFPDTKVLIAGLVNGTNLGDVVIADCTAYLFRKAAAEAKLKKLKIATIDIRKQKDKASLAKVRNSDLVVFPGGGFIKYKQENFPKEMGRIVTRAEHYGIPVMYNAMGVEDYNGEDSDCLAMEELLRKPCNQYITSRDFADFLNDTYLNNHHLSARRVADPAVFCSDVYDVVRDKESDVVGLGVARSELFTDHGVPVTGEQLLDIWTDIISVLDAKGIKWKLFTNGIGKDEAFLTDLLVRLGREGERESVSLPRPQTSRELVENISGFSSVIAVRMHANIIAFSLGIPSVAFVWNDKLRFFGQSIGYPDRFIEYDKISDAGYVMDVFEKACKEGCSQKILDREKDSAYASVKDFFVPFSKELLSSRRRDLTNVKFVCYGLPNLNSPKLNTELFETQVDYYVSDDKELVGTQCLGKPVYSSKKLRKLLGKKPFVIISETIDYYPASETLKSYGYKERYDFTNMHSYKRYVFKKGDVFINTPQITAEK